MIGIWAAQDIEHRRNYGTGSLRIEIYEPPTFEILNY